MDEKLIQDLAERFVSAVENMASGAPGWWVIASPIAVFIAAAVAAIIGWRNLKKQQKALDKQQDALEQRSEADARAEWWKRVQWALEATTSEDPVMRDYGLAAINFLAQSDLAGDEEKLMFDAVWQEPDTEMDEAVLDELADAAIAAQQEAQEEAYRLERYARDAPDEPVDDDGNPGDNGLTKEGSND